MRRVLIALVLICYSVALFMRNQDLEVDPLTGPRMSEGYRPGQEIAARRVGGLESKQEDR